MPVFEIPLSAAADEDDFTLDVELDGRAYTLGLSYSALDDRWYIDVALTRASSTPAPIVSGIAVSARYPVLAGVVGPDRPAGELEFVCDRDPARADLGTVARLTYVDAAQLALEAP